eukprot:SAG31_NODE_208_length_20313_cov_6.143119_14_plen_83_part_00
MQSITESKFITIYDRNAGDIIQRHLLRSHRRGWRSEIGIYQSPAPQKEDRFTGPTVKAANNLVYRNHGWCSIDALRHVTRRA